MFDILSSLLAGEYVKTGLAEVEAWIHAAGKEWVGESWDELRYIRQVPGLACLEPDSAHVDTEQSRRHVQDLFPLLTVSLLSSDPNFTIKPSK